MGCGVLARAREVHPVFADPVRELDGLAADEPPRPLRPKPPLIFNTWIRLLIALGMLSFTLILFAVLFVVLGLNPLRGGAMGLAGQALIQICGTLVTYLVLVMAIERRRPPIELAPRRAGGLLVGLAGGTAAMCVVYLLIMALGGYRLGGLGHPNMGMWWAMVLMVGLGAGISEEIFFRGLLFRFVEEGLGTWGAVLVSGLVFGLVHITNPDASWWGAIAIALEAGLSLALMYALTRSLWLVIGFHAGWNVIQGPILGVVVSGSGRADGLLVTRVQGADLISGGRFGAEASIVAVLVLLALTIALARMAVRRNMIVAPRWVRRRRQRKALESAPAGAQTA